MNWLAARLFEIAADTGDCPTRSDTTDEDVDVAFGITVNFWTGSAKVNVGVSYDHSLRPPDTVSQGSRCGSERTAEFEV